MGTHIVATILNSNICFIDLSILYFFNVIAAVVIKVVSKKTNVHNVNRLICLSYFKKNFTNTAAINK